MSVVLDIVKIATDKDVQSRLASLVALSAGVFDVNLAYDFVSKEEQVTPSGAGVSCSGFFYPNLPADESGAGDTPNVLFFGGCTLVIKLTTVQGPVTADVYIVNKDSIASPLYYRKDISPIDPLVQDYSFTVDIPPVPWRRIEVVFSVGVGGAVASEVSLIRNGLYIRW